MKTNKVVTITLNPALDLTGSLDSLNTGSVSLVNESDFHAAGKGVNVAQVLSDLGAKVTVTGFLGRDNQEMFCQLFDKIGATDEFVRIEGATRINVKLVESGGKVSDINFPGISVSAQAIADFEHKLLQLAETHDYFVLAGSLPNGVSPQQCAKWIELLKSKGKKVLFDSSREALKEGVDAAPWLIKPNEEELSAFAGRTLKTTADCQPVAEALAKQGIENIVVSMGADGVLWLNKSRWLKGTPPKMNVVSTVGAGDTLVAALCWGHMQLLDREELLTFATALSALAVSQVGVGAKDRAAIEAVKQQVQVSEL